MLFVQDLTRNHCLGQLKTKENSFGAISTLSKEVPSSRVTDTS